jgi:hypothetical protein
VATYPETPPGWTAVDRRHTGRFTTHVKFLREDGGTTEWHSRAHRKGASLLSRPGGSGWWAPARASWWIAVLFIIGSACFAIGPFPGFVQLVGADADAAVFFAGSLFFTAAATLQYLETVNADRGPDRVGARRRLRVLSLEPHCIDWWAAVVQLAGTLFSCRSLGDAERLANAGRMRMGKAIPGAEDGAWVRSGRLARHSRAVCWSCVAMSGSAPE